MPDEDYPRLPDLPTTAGTVAAPCSPAPSPRSRSPPAATTPCRCSPACGWRSTANKLTLAATDRYRLAVRELTWTPANSAAADVQVLVPARTLHDAAKSLAGDAELTIALSASGGAARGSSASPAPAGAPRPGCSTRSSRPTGRCCPTIWVTAEVSVAALTEAVKRVALVADRGTPVRLEFADGGGDPVRRRRGRGHGPRRPRGRLRGRTDHHGVQPGFLLDGLGAIGPGGPVAVHHAEQAGRDPPGRRGRAAADYTYLIMPVRLPG